MLKLMRIMKFQVFDKNNYTDACVCVCVCVWELLWSKMYQIVI